MLNHQIVQADAVKQARSSDEPRNPYVSGSSNATIWQRAYDEERRNYQRRERKRERVTRIVNGNLAELVDEFTHKQSKAIGNLLVAILLEE